MNTDQTTTPEPCTLRVHFKSEREAIERLCVKVFGATPVYPPPLMQIDKDGIMRPVPWERPTLDESDVLATLERVERELAEARQTDTAHREMARLQLERLSRELAEARAQRDRLAEALRELLETHDEDEGCEEFDDDVSVGAYERDGVVSDLPLTFGTLRRARAALAAVKL